MVNYLTLNRPFLVMGYDWERYGKHTDESRNEEDRRLAYEGILSILEAHDEYEAPLTIFILGKMLEIPMFREFARMISRKYSVDYLDLQQHTYSHICIRDHSDKGIGAEIDVMRNDIMRASSLIYEVTGRQCNGLASAHSFYRGLQGQKDRQRILIELGIEYLRSDARGPGDKRPAMVHDEMGKPRSPYFYDECGELLEIPGHGNSDNYLKHLSKMKPLKDWSINMELRDHISFFDIAIKESIPFAPLNHPWSIAMKDPETQVIRGLLKYARTRNVEILNYSHINRMFRERF